MQKRAQGEAVAPSHGGHGRDGHGQGQSEQADAGSERRCDEQGIMGKGTQDVEDDAAAAGFLAA